jgi:Alginate export
MVTGGVGRRFAEWALTPELWFYFDYASGNSHPGSNSYSTFNQLFPLGHKYFGYMDIVGRQNILDPNVNLKFTLSKRANLSFWFHDFHLASARDALYNGAGTPIRSDPTGRAGRYVGNELDIVLNIFVNPNTDWQIGFCEFWAGPFVRETAKDPAQTQNANFFYTQFTFRF